MKNYWKRLGAVLVIALSMFSAACSNNNDNSQPAKENQSVQKEETRVITDMGGNEVEIPNNIETVAITCYGGVTHELYALGFQNKIIAQPSMDKFKVLTKMYPDFKEIPDIGTFDKVNVEEALKHNPDIVIASVGSPDGNKKLREAGIPVVEVLTGTGNIERLKDEFSLMGEIFNNKERADELISYWDSKISFIKDRTDDLTEKTEVYYMLGDITHTNGKDLWGDDLISVSGGKNVAHEISKETKDVSLEQVIEWNPELIILSENEGKYMHVDDILNNPQLANIKAIEEQRVYQCPKGNFWWDRPSPESVLGFIWLSQTIYPDKFEDLDLKQETKDFYKEFYGYNLSDEEYEDFLNHGPEEN